jgi:hypothetical protein
MRTWLFLAAMLVACSGEGDEVEAPMLGDCAHCGTAPISGGGSSGFPDASSSQVDADAAVFDSTPPDGLDIVDVIVNLDAPFP